MDEFVGWPQERIEQVFLSLNEEQQELLSIVYILYLRAVNAAELASKQAERLFRMYSTDEPDIKDWKEADHEWGNEGESPIDAEPSERDDGQVGTRRESEGNAGEAMEPSAED